MREADAQPQRHRRHRRHRSTRESHVISKCAGSQPLVARAIVWQDRRTTDFCQERRTDALDPSARAGLVLDPYFSGTKFAGFRSS